VIVVGGALVWQLWPAHRSSTARTPHAQATQAPPPVAASSAASPSNVISSTTPQPPAPPPSQQQAAAVAPPAPPLPAEPPRLEGVERALSALRERRAERESLNTQNERAGEMNRMPPAEGLLPRTVFRWRRQ